jgi:hypothetical protein
LRFSFDFNFWLSNKNVGFGNDLFTLISSWNVFNRFLIYVTQYG